MNVLVKVGDVLAEKADVLICSANPWLNMSGGVNGALREREPGIQSELHAHLQRIGESALPAGSVVSTSAGNLAFLHVIHAVAIDPFYDSSHQTVVDTLSAAFDFAASLKARSIALPTLATGYGPMSIEAFARAFLNSMADRIGIDTVTIVVRSEESATTIGSVLGVALVDTNPE